MIVKNIGNKIINIGSNALMPDCQIKVGDSIKRNPAISAFVERGYIKLVEENGSGEVSLNDKPAVSEGPEDQSVPAEDAHGSEDRTATNSDASDSEAPKRTKKSAKHTASAESESES